MLDQSPVPTGSTPAQALQNSITLARLVDALGYNRFWMSEHHAMDTIACTAPEVMLARIGAETRRIRIGSGGIMLPHYTPLKHTFTTFSPSKNHTFAPHFSKTPFKSHVKPAFFPTPAQSRSQNNLH